MIKTERRNFAKRRVYFFLPDVSSRSMPTDQRERPQALLGPQLPQYLRRNNWFSSLVRQMEKGGGYK